MPTGHYRYDIVKEGTIAFVAVLVLTVILASALSSPDDKPVTLRSWAQSAPVDFVTTAATELDGSSATAQYGPPYNATAGVGQKIGPVSPQRLAGVHEHVDTAQDFVIGPLTSASHEYAGLDNALSTYEGASSSQQSSWIAAYEKALANATFTNGNLVFASGNYGPVSTMMSAELAMARSGALDGYLLASPQFYGTDYTKPLLFLADGTYMADLAHSKHLQGNQWGMMNETGRYPGQAWLWLYTVWYQIPPFTHTTNADALIWCIMAAFSVIFVLVPFIPGLRAIPRYIPIYKLIWREHYRRRPGHEEPAPPGPGTRPEREAQAPSEARELSRR